MTTSVETLNDLASYVGKELGTSFWVDVDQDRINAFADATDDHQWIHVDAERAKDGPFGGTIAHGYLTLSLLIPMWTDILEVGDVHTMVNYGLNKVRFPSPVPSGSKIRRGPRSLPLRPSLAVRSWPSTFSWNGKVAIEPASRSSCCAT